MWLEFLKSFNGKSYFPESSWTGNEAIQFFTDSAGSAGLGCGAYFSGEWVYFSWPTNWSESGILKDITFLEFVPVVLAMAVWGHRLQNKKIIFNIDNMALVEILNSQTSKSKRIMHLMRHFVLHTLKNNTIFRGKHIKGKINEIADAISRQQWCRFKRLAPEANREPQGIPVHFLQLISSTKLTDF